jgi:chromosome segregation ATPase
LLTVPRFSRYFLHAAFEVRVQELEDDLAKCEAELTAAREDAERQAAAVVRADAATETARTDGASLRRALSAVKEELASVEARLTECRAREEEAREGSRELAEKCEL